MLWCVLFYVKHTGISITIAAPIAASSNALMTVHNTVQERALRAKIVQLSTDCGANEISPRMGKSITHWEAISPRGRRPDAERPASRDDALGSVQSFSVRRATGNE